MLAATALVHAGNRIEGLAVFKDMIFAHVLGALGLLTNFPWCFVFFALPSCRGTPRTRRAGRVRFPSALIAVAFSSAILSASPRIPTVAGVRAGRDLSGAGRDART